MNEVATILHELKALACYYSGLQTTAGSRIYADLAINGSDFIEFV